MMNTITSNHQTAVLTLLRSFPKLSESFADCQDFLQLQDQEFYRLKLQHALDLKVELSA